MESVPKIPGLWRRKNVWQYRIRTPKDLVTFMGRESLNVSLKTTDHAEAVRRSKTIALEFQQRFDAARRERDATVTSLSAISQTELQVMVAKWFHDMHTANNEADLIGGMLTPEEQQLQRDEHEAFKAIFRDRLARNDLSLAEFQADAVLRENRVSLPKESPSYRLLCQMVIRGFIEEVGQGLARGQGDFTGKTADPIFEGATAAPPKQRGKTLGEVYQLYMDDPQVDRSPKTEACYTSVFNILVEMIGEHRPVKSIDREMCKDIREVIMSLPVNAKKHFPRLSARQAVERGRARGLPTVSRATVNKYLNKLSALFKWAVKEEYIDRNPAEGLRIPDKVRRKDKRRSFDIDQLNKIFHAPLYTGCKNDGYGYAQTGTCRPRGGRFWVPLISLFSGMRMNEVCQLNVEDVRGIDGVPCIIITADAEEGEDDKRIKTAAGERFVPVHPELVRIGLLRHVENRRQAGDSKLFPDIKKASTGYYSDTFSKFFARFLEKAGAEKPKTSFHSFRHNYRDALREAKIPREVVHALGGWSNSDTDTSDDYGDGFKASTLLEAIKQVHYPGLDLSHLEGEGKDE